MRVSGEFTIKTHYLSRTRERRAFSLIASSLTRLRSCDRWINEMLYKSDSQKAAEMMHEDPSMFQEVRPPFSHN